MNIYLTIATILANLFSIAIVYQFIKKLEKKQIIIFIAISVATMYVLVSGVYWLSGFGVEESIHNASKNFVTYIFVPVNVILFIPYLASRYMKLQTKEIKKEEFVRKVRFLPLLLLIVLVVEFFYFRNIQNNITQINQNVVTTNKETEN